MRILRILRPGQEESGNNNSLSSSLKALKVPGANLEAAKLLQVLQGLTVLARTARYWTVHPVHPHTFSRTWHPVHPVHGEMDIH